VIGQEIAHYRILEKLGEGGMGIVYKAVDINLDRIVAIKLLTSDLGNNPELAERFRSEARVQATLNNPNIAMLYAFLIWEGRAVMVMEYIEGETFQQMIGRRGPIPSDIAVPLFKQALLGIGAAHRRGIVHRDIKPANMMLNREGLVKVMDFGIAKVLGVTGMTRTNVQMGTAWYMAPEQVLNKAIDARTDVYALGITLYEMLSGIVPFSADSEYEILTAQVQQEPLPPTTHYPHIPPAVEAAVMRALSKDPNRRFASTAEFGLALEGFTGPRAEVTRPDPLAATVQIRTPTPAPVTRRSDTVLSPPLDPTPQPAGWSTRRKQIAAGAGVLVLLLITALIFFLSRPTPQPDQLKDFKVHPPGESGGPSKASLEEAQQAEQEQSARELQEKLKQEQAQAQTTQTPAENPPPHASAPEAKTNPEPRTPPAQPEQTTTPDEAYSPATPKEPSEAQYSQALNGNWMGTYRCAQGLNAVQLQINANSLQNITALMRFAVPNSQPGSYYMRGSFVPQSRRIMLVFTSWQNEPPGYIPANMAGTVDVEQGTIQGKVLLPTCGTFSVRRQ
jgi:serine/threonine protein kinase